MGHTDGSVLNNDSECPGRGSRTPAVRARSSSSQPEAAGSAAGRPGCTLTDRTRVVIPNKAPRPPRVSRPHAAELAGSLPPPVPLAGLPSRSAQGPETDGQDQCDMPEMAPSSRCPPPPGVLRPHARSPPPLVSLAGASQGRHAGARHEPPRAGPPAGTRRSQRAAPAGLRRGAPGDARATETLRGRARRAGPHRGPRGSCL